MLINDYAELLFYLRQVRISKELNRQEVADLSGISKSSIMKYEQGIHAMNMPKLMQYLDALDCHLVLIPDETLTEDLAKLIDTTVGEHIKWTLIHRNRRRGAVDVSKLMPRFPEKRGRRKRGFASSASKKLEALRLRKEKRSVNTSFPKVLVPRIKDMDDDYNSKEEI